MHVYGLFNTCKLDNEVDTLSNAKTFSRILMNILKTWTIKLATRVTVYRYFTVIESDIDHVPAIQIIHSDLIHIV